MSREAITLAIVRYKKFCVFSRKSTGGRTVELVKVNGTIASRDVLASVSLLSARDGKGEWEERRKQSGDSCIICN